MGRRTVLAGGLALAACAPQGATQPLTLFAAASLTDAMSEAAEAFTRETGAPVRTVFAGSGEIARQIQAGAPADLVVLADEAWMDRLVEDGAVRPASRIDLLTNRLVVIAPADRPAAPFAWTGRIAIGDPDSVPAGRYARAMMQKLGVWDAAQGRIVTAADVRAVRGFVARGDADLGVVYATDLAGFDDAEVVFTPPETAQPRIVYPAALTMNAAAGPEAGRFLAWLGGPQATPIFDRYGFGRAA